MTDFQNSFTDRYASKYESKPSLTIPPHLEPVATLPYETSISAN